MVKRDKVTIKTGNLDQYRQFIGKNFVEVT